MLSHATFLKRNKACITLPCNLLKKKQSMYHSAMQPFKKKETKHVSLCHATFLKKRQSIYNSALRPLPDGEGWGGAFF